MDRRMDKRSGATWINLDKRSGATFRWIEGWIKGAGLLG